MKQRDPGWDSLGSAIDRGLSNNKKLAGDGTVPCTPTELAQRLTSFGVGPEDVRNWIRGRSNPRLSLVPEIGVALAGDASTDDLQWDPLALPKAMGVVPTSERNVPELVYSISKLQQRLTKLQEEVSRFGRNVGASAVVSKACRLAWSGEAVWAVATWPAVEGPQECRMHVADRIDFRRVDGSLARADDVRSDFQDELYGVGAVEGAVSPRWVEDADPTVSKWAIPHLGSPRSSTVNSPWPQVASVAVVATTVRAWANDVASHLADALGYGQTSTRDLSMDLHGYRLGAQAERDRDTLQKWLMDRPPVKRVWSHWSDEQVTLPSSDSVVVALIEDDELLALEARSAKAASDLATLKKARNKLASAAAGRHRTITLRVGLPVASSSTELRDRRFEQALECAAQALEAVSREGWLTTEQLVTYWNRDGSASQQAILIRNWLRSRLEVGRG